MDKNINPQIYAKYKRNVKKKHYSSEIESMTLTYKALQWTRPSPAILRSLPFLVELQWPSAASLQAPSTDPASFPCTQMWGAYVNSTWLINHLSLTLLKYPFTYNKLPFCIGKVIPVEYCGLTPYTQTNHRWLEHLTLKN